MLQGQKYSDQISTSAAYLLSARAYAFARLRPSPSRCPGWMHVRRIHRICTCRIQRYWLGRLVLYHGDTTIANEVSNMRNTLRSHHRTIHLTQSSVQQSIARIQGFSGRLCGPFHVGRHRDRMEDTCPKLDRLCCIETACTSGAFPPNSGSGAPGRCHR